MRVAITIILSILALGLFQNRKPEVGDILDRRLIPKETGRCALDSQEGDSPCGLIVLNDIEYRITYDEQTLKITHIRTIDPTFMTTEGFFADGYVDIREDQIVGTEGMDILGPTTADGWQLVIGTEALHQPFMTICVDARNQHLSLFRNNPFKAAGSGNTVKVKIVGFVRFAKQLPAA